MENKEKRAAILNSTVRSIAEHGFHGAPIAVIASHAGVAVGTIYRFFESKDRLIEETYRKVEGRCLAAAMKDYPSRGSIRQRLSHLAHGLIRHFMRFPAEFLFMDQFHSSPYRKSYIPSEPAVAELCTIVRLLREGTELQLLKDMPPAILLALGCGPLIQGLRAHTTGMVHCNEGLISAMVESCWDLLSRREA